MDATLNGTWLEDRFGDPLVFGVQGGGYLGSSVRLAIRLEMPTKNARDEYEDDSVPPTGLGPTPTPPTFTSSSPRDSAPPTLFYGGTLGLIATRGENFVFAPGLLFMRSDVSDYGSVVGISMPFEWITARGMRFGLELDLGRAFGGTVRTQTCTSNTTSGAQSCTESEMDRPAGRAFALRFQMGFGLARQR